MCSFYITNINEFRINIHFLIERKCEVPDMEEIRLTDSEITELLAPELLLM